MSMWLSMRVCISSITGVESNFYSVSSAFVTTQGVPYDYDSIMHYGAYAFSRNSRPTITPLVKDFPLRRLGQRERLSTRDVEHIHTLYCKSGELCMLNKADK